MLRMQQLEGRKEGNHMPTLSTADAKVSEQLIEEIDSIKTATGSEEDLKVSYEPQAWTREGRVD